VVCCPRCRSTLLGSNLGPHCSDRNCRYAIDGFPVVNHQPILIDFENSIFQRENFESGHGSVLPRDDTGRNWQTRFRRFITGGNPVAVKQCAKFVTLLTRTSQRPRVVIVGGGAIGAGARLLYEDSRIDVVGVDVYASAHTDLVADGHHLPFVAGSFDGVWIQAVLEHVLEPQTVVDEIARVLRDGGLVYADTPFMQQVHEEAYDFTRLTMSGQRWLFRRFTQLDAGAVGGAGTALVWSIRYFVRALGTSNKLATAAALSFFWLRFLDPWTRRRANLDAASGTFILAQKSPVTLRPHDMVAYYRTQHNSATR
jgi:SAM-dependent methyltransferase